MLLQPALSGPLKLTALLRLAAGRCARARGRFAKARGLNPPHKTSLAVRNEPVGTNWIDGTNYFGSEFLDVYSRCLWSSRKFIVGLAFKRATPSRLARSVPLLEKKRNACAATLVTHRENPFSLHGPRTRPAFASDDHPMDSIQIQFSHIFKQGFDRKKSNRGGRHPVGGRLAVPS